MKMEPIECSETSAFSTQTPGRYPKENALLIRNCSLTEIFMSDKNSITSNRTYTSQMGRLTCKWDFGISIRPVKGKTLCAKCLLLRLRIKTDCNYCASLINYANCEVTRKLTLNYIEGNELVTGYRRECPK